MKSKAKGKILAVFVFLAMVFTVVPMMGGAAHAGSEVTIDGVTYALTVDADNNKVVRVTRYDSEYTWDDEVDVDVEILAQVDFGGVEYPVTSIGYHAFVVEPVTSVKIPASVAQVEPLAFRNCHKLRTVAFAKGSQLKIIDLGAFSFTGLTVIAMPAGVTDIKETAFAGTRLKTVYFTGTEAQWNSMYRHEDWAKGCQNIDVVFVESAEDVPKGKTLTYNGEEQTGVEAGTAYRLEGTVKATNAGVYTASARLLTAPRRPKRVWTDGTTERKYITWEIKEAEVTVSGPVTVSTDRKLIYNGKTQTGVAAGTGYTLSGAARATNAGTYTAKATLKSSANVTYRWSDGTTAAKTIRWTISKAANPLTVKGKTATVKGSAKGKKGKLKKTRTLPVRKVIAFAKKGRGKMTYAKVSGNKKLRINKSTGKVTVKKGLRKGTYRVKVKVRAAGDANYNASAWKTVIFKVRVK